MALRVAALAVVLAIAAGAAVAGLTLASSGSRADSVSFVPLRGRFHPDTQATAGRASVVERGGHRELRLVAFHTKAAPELYLYVLQPNGKSSLLGKLHSPGGDQTYRVPDSLDVRPGAAVVVWCDYC